MHHIPEKMIDGAIVFKRLSHAPPRTLRPDEHRLWFDANGVLQGIPSSGATLKKYVVDFTPSSWTAAAPFFRLLVPASSHLLGPNPLAQIRTKNADGTFTEVAADIRYSAAGDVTVISNSAFSGKLILI